MKSHLFRVLPATLLFAFAGCSQMPIESGSTGSAAHSGSSASKAEIRALFDQWNRSLATGDPQIVAANYAPDAVLIPTLSNKVRATHAGRVDYFEHFLAKRPSGTINESHIRVFGNIAINSGTYTFRFKDGTSAAARFTFVYRRDPRGWRIVEHHSSRMPETKK